MALEPHEKLVGYHPKAFHQKTAGLRLNAKKRHRLVKEFAENLEFHLKERQRQRQQQQQQQLPTTTTTTTTTTATTNNEWKSN